VFGVAQSIMVKPQLLRNNGDLKSITLNTSAKNSDSADFCEHISVLSLNSHNKCGFVTL